MPKFMKDGAIALIDGGIESYLLALYGMTLPSMRTHRKQETKYAPVIGLFGTAVELLLKSCLVQAKGLSAVYKDGDTASGVYRFGTEVLDELRKEVRDATPCIAFLWKIPDDYTEQQSLFLFYLNKFKLLQELRANGFHAGIGCSRDITVTIANEIYQFITLLSQSKRLRAYLKNIPTPEATVRDREAIIEDLSRRMNSVKDQKQKTEWLRSMYLVLPYIPEIEPDWIEAFDKISVTPPTSKDVNYLVKTLTDAHSIYLLKNRGGKDGIPVRVDPDNPDALPISIQNIKRVLSTIPDQFNNDILTANTRLEQKRLDLPIDDFLIDLFALGLRQAKILTNDLKLTAQQVWPFVVSAYSTQGTPRPCWFFVRSCDELDKLVSFLEIAKEIGNGYFLRRVDTVIKCVLSVIKNEVVNISFEKDNVFGDIKPFYEDAHKRKGEKLQPFTPSFIRKYPLNDKATVAIQEFITGNLSAGNTLHEITRLDRFGANEKKAALALLNLCNSPEDKNGLIAVLRSKHFEGNVSLARKILFFIDFYTDGPDIKGLQKQASRSLENF